MKRHPLDILSLLMGTVFLLVAVAYVFGDLRDEMPSSLITMPLMLAGLGIAGLVGAFAAMQRAGERTQSAPYPTAPQTDWSAAPYPGEPVSVPDSPVTTAPAAPIPPTSPIAEDTVVFPAEGPAGSDT